MHEIFTGCLYLHFIYIPYNFENILTFLNVCGHFQFSILDSEWNDECIDFTMINLSIKLIIQHV